MGIKKFRFWHDIFHHLTKRDKVLVEKEFAGQTWGVDILPWIYDDPQHFAELAHAVATPDTHYYEPTRLMRRIAQRHERLLAIHIEPIYVFPGAENPLRMQRQRDLQCASYLSRFHAKYATGDLQHHHGPQSAADSRRIAKYRALDLGKFCSHLTNTHRFADPRLLPWIARWMQNEQGMRVLGAPYEAAWQLVELERANITQGTFGHDAALVWAGAQQILAHSTYTCSFSSRPMTAYHFRAERDIPAARVGKKKKRVFYQERKHYLPEAAACYGTEYNERLSGGPLAHVLSQQFRKWAQAMEQHEGDTFWQRLGETDAFALHMRRVANQFRYGPVVSTTTAAPNGDTTATLEPLNPVPEGMTWEECLGFDPLGGFEGLEHDAEDYARAMRFDGRTFLNESLDETRPWYAGVSPILKEQADGDQAVIAEQEVQDAKKAQNRRVVDDYHEPILGW